MTLQALLAVALILFGSLLDVPIATILGIVSLALETVRQAWSRRGLARVEYARRLARHRTAWGDLIPLEVEVWNRGRMPLAWLRADDAASPGLIVRERALTDSDRGRALRNVWTLAPSERVTRRYHVGGVQRGVFELGPVELSVGDLFAQHAARDERPRIDRFFVHPRVVAAPALRRRDRWGGFDRALAGLSEDPARFAGVREYAPGDPVRRIHARTSARLGRPMVKRFEPSRDREVILALDVQSEEAPAWDLSVDEEVVESLFVIVASLARSLAAEGAAMGLAAAAYSGAVRRFAMLPVSSAPGQLERLLDLLARLSPQPSAPFEQLLSTLARVARPGSTIVIVSARDSRQWTAQLRTLQRAGCGVVILATGAADRAPAGPPAVAGSSRFDIRRAHSTARGARPSAS